MKNISVMIVDDEKLAINYCISLIDWEKNGFEIVATAFNGKQALKKYKEMKPDVIITDMSMPIMDGSEMIRQLREMGSESEIVIFSSYEDFSYAQAAIRYGINDYIIKTELTEDSLKKILSKIKNKLNDKTNKEFSENSVILGKYLIDKNKDNKDIIPKDSVLSKEKFFYIFFQQRVPIKISNDIPLEDIQHPIPTIENVILSQNFGLTSRVAVTPLSSNLLIMLFKDNPKVAQSISNITDKIVGILRDELENEFFAYFGSKPLNISELKLIYSKRKIFSKYKYMTSDTNYLNLSTLQKVTRTLSAEISDEEINLLLGSNEDDFSKCIDTLYSKALNEKNFDRLLELSKKVYSYLLKLESQNTSNSFINLDWSTNWQAWLTFDEFKNWAKLQYSICIKGNVSESAFYSKAVLDIMNYVKSNYQRPDLSLNDIAEHVNLSCGYLCSLFKTETDMTINKYILDVRINEAKKLLAKRKKIYEVSEAVGFTSSQYFSQVFFKKTGVYPRQYREGESI